MMEMLWTDPQKAPGRGPSKRGVGMQFGPDVTKRFCDKNGLDAIIRSHEVRMDGYEEEHDGKCITGKMIQSAIELYLIVLTLFESSRHQSTATRPRTGARISTLVLIISSASTNLTPFLIRQFGRW